MHRGRHCIDAGKGRGCGRVYSGCHSCGGRRKGERGSEWRERAQPKWEGCWEKVTTSGMFRWNCFGGRMCKFKRSELCELCELCECSPSRHPANNLFLSQRKRSHALYHHLSRATSVSGSRQCYMEMPLGRNLPTSTVVFPLTQTHFSTIPDQLPAAASGLSKSHRGCSW